MITSSFPIWHQAKLQEFLNETTPDPMNVRAIARELNVLPLMGDMGGCFAIRSDGEVISFLWDNDRDIKQENNARIRNIALFQGSKKYPELSALIPPRPPEATTCHHCNGTGIEPMSVKLQLDNIVCYCGGLGWLPPES
jgi:hypothetical protein